MHCPVRMRFLECPPDLGQEGYVDEAERFFSDPLHWLRVSFPDKFSQPTHLLLFDVLEKVRDVTAGSSPHIAAICENVSRLIFLFS